jgi:pyrroline-5-carboxylate reductase
MPLGFIGTGEITSAMVTGLSSSAAQDSIRLSPRNLAIATDLANRFPDVSIAPSNQDVLDTCETIVIAVRPSVVRGVLSELRFRPDHHVISVVSALSLQSVSRLVVPAIRVTRAVPLPSTAKRIGPTAIYPPDPFVNDLFAAIGTVFELESEDEFEAFCATTGTIAFAYAFLDGIASWLSRNNIPEGKARDYIARMFSGLASTAVDAAEQPFESLARQHATAGGINEQFLKHMVERGLLASVSGGLDVILQRIRSASRES